MSHSEDARPRSIVRSEYLIDRHRVIFESSDGWHCVCAEFTSLGACKHTRESEGRRAAQKLIRDRVRSVDGILSRFSHREESTVPVAIARRAELTS